MLTSITLAGAAGADYILDLRGPTPNSSLVGYNKVGSITISVNGTSGDFWISPVQLPEGVALPAVPTDPRPTAGNQSAFLQIKSGESLTLNGPQSSRGYDQSSYGGGFYTHVLVYCVAAGTVTATQLRVTGS